MPAVMRGFCVCVMQTAALAALARCVKVEVYALQRQGSKLEALLQALADQVPKHSAPAPLQECLHSLAHLAAQEHAVCALLSASAAGRTHKRDCYSNAARCRCRALMQFDTCLQVPC